MYLFKEKRIIYLSPHMDDCCFSSAGLINQIISDGGKVELLNIFAISNYTYREVTEDISKIRKIEDKRFCNYISIKQNVLNYGDSSMRNYTEASEIVSNDYIDNTSSMVFNEINEFINNIEPDYVICPIGIGNHVDHLIVKNFANFGRMNKSSYKMLFYEDLPYAYNYSYEEVEFYARAFGLDESIKINITSFLEEKEKLCKIYKSQIGESTIHDIINYAGRFDKNEKYERIWHKE